MNEPDWKGALGEAFEESLAYLQGLPLRPIPSQVDLSTLRAALGGAVPERPVDFGRWLLILSPPRIKA